MRVNSIPDVYEIPRQKLGNTIPWITAVSILAMIVGAMLTLVMANS